MLDCCNQKMCEIYCQFDANTCGRCSNDVNEQILDVQNISLAPMDKFAAFEVESSNTWLYCDQERIIVE